MLTCSRATRAHYPLHPPPSPPPAQHCRFLQICNLTRKELANPTWSWDQAGLQVGVIDREPLPSFQEGVIIKARGLFRVYVLTQFFQLVICEVGFQYSPSCIGCTPCRGKQGSLDMKPKSTGGQTGVRQE